MVVLPIDGNVEEAEHVAREDRDELTERRPVITERNFQLEYHDGDDDGDHTVSEGIQAVVLHDPPSFQLSLSFSVSILGFQLGARELLDPLGKNLQATRRKPLVADFGSGRAAGKSSSVAANPLPHIACKDLNESEEWARARLSGS
jgi:hypothetical protein